MNKSNIKRFNVRVYGLLINNRSEILVSDELIKKGTVKVTKFPGGGLHFGEGLRECLSREFSEETGVSVEVKEHIYTTDFFVPSAFDDDSQVIAVYYRVQTDEWEKIPVSDKKFDFNVPPGVEAERFRWVPLSELDKEESIHLPTDKLVVNLLLRTFSESTKQLYGY
ncbi:MAG: NUDIX domain-containing protein [Chitinophagales bacterium]|nr:NUDIX domain-containing protein [Chitinophagales bacterium]MDW8273767.1 NUDIX domain-containing protein [Chitinophagales bacterium]